MRRIPTIDTMAMATGPRRAARVPAAPAGYVATATFAIKRHGWMNRPRGPGGGS